MGALITEPRVPRKAGGSGGEGDGGKKSIIAAFSAPAEAVEHGHAAHRHAHADRRHQPVTDNLLRPACPSSDKNSHVNIK